MDLSLTTEQESFLRRATTWLEANVPSPPLSSQYTADGFAAHRDWEHRLYEAGFAGADWPVADGGHGLDPVSSLLFHDAYVKSGAPARVNHVGLNLCGPTITRFGTDHQRRRWLQRILRCDDLWALGLSEPGAGSDLAALRSRGRVGDGHMVVTGQKTWITNGHRADWVATLVRTSDESKASRGLTMVAIPADAPGFSTRPIVQANGEAGIAEVFLDDVTVPLENVIGGVGNGWAVVMGTFEFERGAATNSPAGIDHLVEEIVAIASDTARAGDPVIRDRIAAAYIEARMYRLNAYRNLALDGRGLLKYEGSRMKVLWSETQLRLYELGLDILGEAALHGPDPAVYHRIDRWEAQAWYARAACIYGGANEVQRDIVAERILGLPREPRVRG